MRKLLNCIALIILVMSVSLPVVSAEVKNLDLESAINIAKEQNLELKLATLNLEKAKLEYQKKKANNLLNQSRYSELQAEYNLNVAENTYQNTINTVINNTIQQYTKLWLYNLDLEVKEKKVEVEKFLLEEAKAQYEIGDIGSVDLLEQENTYKDAEFALETARDDYQQNLREFKTTLGLTETEPVLADLKHPEVWQITEKEAINAALENSIELQLKGEELELARIDLERTKVSSAELDKELKKIALELSQVDKEKTKEDIINSVQEAYYQFKQAVKNMGLKKERLTEAQEKYRLVQKQYEIGLLTITDVLQYEINMLQAEYEYKNAIASYYLEEQSLRQTIGLQSEVFANEISEDE